MPPVNTVMERQAVFANQDTKEMEASVWRWTLVQDQPRGAAAAMQNASELAGGPTPAYAVRDGPEMEEIAQRSTPARCPVLAAATTMQPACM